MAMVYLNTYPDLFTKFIKFGLVGASGVLVDFGITYLLKEKAKVHQYIANAIGFTIAASTNYLFNRIYTFHSQNPNLLEEYGKFLAVSMVGLAINSLVIWILVSKLKWNFYFAKVFAIGAATIWNFFANLLVTFI
ncbi:Putative flippase GtrA (transmembrane translocase of bactoprenol-linked glucose) [Williamwhitmania taraxaci]|uniref:Putative flippase GtrA (Transmembrane translocase of bactoprenol-linked glucose) n=2 Tax=Williamwhitmania taraxaci TaxID=1640674 RepID=A0A1G6TCZ5_9BACT|nr:Putative flippase GtrA (transmembrane translocase of bactoprenol-linked glucose) [Williamwhitmania taraxaci]